MSHRTERYSEVRCGQLSRRAQAQRQHFKRNSRYVYIFPRFCPMSTLPRSSIGTAESPTNNMVATFRVLPVECFPVVTLRTSRDFAPRTYGTHAVCSSSLHGPCPRHFFATITQFYYRRPRLIVVIIQTHPVDVQRM